MADRTENIEDLLEGHISACPFKSRGERKIAYFLEENNIKYKYESGVLINQADSKPRIWYPDFYLPEFSTYIEYYGMAGNPDYDKGVKNKKVAYAKAGLNVLPVYPIMFSKNWQGYIMNGIKRKLSKTYMTF